MSEDNIKYLSSIKASLGRGLTGKLLDIFPNIKSVDRPLVDNVILIDPNWATGFTAGEGCFLVKASKSDTGLKTRIQLEFKITQHSRDQYLKVNLIEYFNCGSVIRNKDAIDYYTKKFSDIIEKIIPFFNKYPILGVKYLDFLGFLEVANLMKEKKTFDYWRFK